MKQFTVFIKNKPGELGRVCEVLAQNSINVEALATEGDTGKVKVVTNDIETTKKIFDKEKIQFEMKDVLIIKIINRPGELAKITKKLGMKKINIDSIHLLRNGEFALQVDDIEGAKETLKGIVKF